MKVLVLGHKGMLGHIVYKRLREFSFNVDTINYRWPSKDFVDALKKSDANFLINCIGSIPQRNPESYEANSKLPSDLCKHYKGVIIHPSSDCEKECFTDDYSTSKRNGSNLIANHDKSFVIKSSIIGPEKIRSYGLWAWLENTESDTVNGFTNHLWNGITSLEWANICVEKIEGKITQDVVTAGCKHLCKFELLQILNKLLNLNKTIVPIEHGVSTDRLLEVDLPRKDISLQIKDIVEWSLRSNK